jgi:hypothetical protein
LAFGAPAPAPLTPGPASTPPHPRASSPPRFACHWEHVGKGMAAVVHVDFDTSCLAMPHMAHMAFAVVVALVFMLTCLGLVGGREGGLGKGRAGALLLRASWQL